MVKREKFPELVGVSEIAKLYGKSNQRAHQLTQKVGFPTPVAELASGRIWLKSDVVAWLKANTHHP
jgi:prophage regulatory protein